MSFTKSNSVSSLGNSVNRGVSSIGSTMSRGASNVGNSVSSGLGLNSIGSNIRTSFKGSSSGSLLIGTLVICLLYLYGVNSYVLLLLLIVLAFIALRLPFYMIIALIICVLVSEYLHINIVYLSLILLFIYFVVKGIIPLSLIALIVVIGLLYKFMSNKSSTSADKYEFPPINQHDECPNNWMSKEVAHNNSTKQVCHNYKKKPINEKDPKCKHTMDFHQSQYLGEKGMKNKKEWANDCGVPWNGVDNKVITH